MINNKITYIIRHERSWDEDSNLHSADGQVDKELLGFLKDSLDPFWPTRVLNPIDIPEEIHDKNRNQYDGSALLESLLRKEGAILGVTEVDTYVEGLSFIFGLPMAVKH